MNIVKYCQTLLLVIVLATSCKVNQKVVAPKNVSFDFLDFNKSLKTIEGYKNIKRGEKFQIKITNINKSLWTITDSTKQQNFNVDMPDVFKGVKLPTFLDLSVPTVQGQVVGSSPGSSSVSLQQLNSWFAKIMNVRKTLNEAVALNNTFKNLYSNCNDKFNVIDAELLTEVKNFLPTGEATRATQPDAIRGYLESQTEEAINALEAIKKNLPLYLEAQNSKIESNIKGIIWDWKNDQKPKKPKNEYIIQGRSAQTAELKNEEIKTHIEALKATTNKAEEIVAEIQKFLNENKIEELVNNYNLINESNFTYYSDEIKVKEDEVAINILITATKPLACNLPQKNKIEVEYKTYNGWKVDFSTGLFIMAGNSDFLGRNLYYKPIDSLSTTIQDKNGGRRALLGIGGLMHIYRRSGRNINWALSPGLSTTTNFDGVNFHLGGSLITGGKNRVVFTVGATLKESTILDQQYDLNNVYLKSEMPEAVPSLKVFPRLGGFISITYNWTKLKK